MKPTKRTKASVAETVDTLAIVLWQAKGETTTAESWLVASAAHEAMSVAAGIVTATFDRDDLMEDEALAATLNERLGQVLATYRHHVEHATEPWLDHESPYPEWRR